MFMQDIEFDAPLIQLSLLVIYYVIVHQLMHSKQVIFLCSPTQQAIKQL